MTTTFRILGPGCPKCRLLGERTERAARELGLDNRLEKVTDLDRILEFGIVATPALAVDGEIKVFGHVPTPARLAEILGSAGGGAT